MRCVVTGGAGFIGGALVGRLLAAGDEVVVVDTLVNGRPENVGPDARLVLADVRDAAALRPLFRGVDVVYHLACLGVRHSLRHPEENLAVNATGSVTVLEVARSVGVGRVVHVSSSEVYGTARRTPMREDHPTEPATVYGAGKLAGEALARAAWLSWGFPVVVVRPFNAFGPRSHHAGDAGEVIPRFLLRALADEPLILFGDGAQTRDFCFVDDTAAGIHAAGRASGVEGATFNLARGEGTSLLHLAERIAAVVGRPVRTRHDAPRPGDVRHLVGDASAASARLGWRPNVSLDDGLARTVAWLQAQGAPRSLLAGQRVRAWEDDA